MLQAPGPRGSPHDPHALIGRSHSRRLGRRARLRGEHRQSASAAPRLCTTGRPATGPRGSGTRSDGRSRGIRIRKEALGYSNALAERSPRRDSHRAGCAAGSAWCRRSRAVREPRVSARPPSAEQSTVWGRPEPVLGRLRAPRFRLVLRIARTGYRRHRRRSPAPAATSRSRRSTRC